MRVLLIRPPYKRLKGYEELPSFSLGVGYLASVLEREGHKVGIYQGDNSTGLGVGILPDELTIFRERRRSHMRYLSSLEDDGHPVWRELRGIIEGFSPDLVGVSVLTGEVGSALKVSRLAKEVNSSTAVAWGGAHPTFLAGDTLGYGGVDFIIRGEGEMTIVELCASLERGDPDPRSVRGISFIERDKVVHNPERDLIEDLDVLPVPGAHLILRPEACRRMPFVGVMTSRGCPWKCAYCSSPMFWRRKVRFRSPDKIIDEIEHLTSFFGTRLVNFLDDNFTINSEYVTELCERMIEAKVNVSWLTMTRADILEEKLLKLMKRAGLSGLSIGIESGSDRILGLIEKKVDLRQIREAYDLMYRNGITAGANFIIGFPEETLDDIRETFSLMRSLRTPSIIFNIFEPLPGSPLLKRCVELGLVPERPDWIRFGAWPVNYFLKNVSREEFERLSGEIAEWVYRYHQNIIRRLREYRLFIANDPFFILRKGWSYIRRRLIKLFLMVRSER